METIGHIVATLLLGATVILFILLCAVIGHQVFQFAKRYRIALGITTGSIAAVYAVGAIASIWLH